MYEAMIFDCDGTLADSMPPHYLSWRDTLSRYGIAFSEDLFYEMGGWSTLKVVKFLLDRDGVIADPLKVAEEKEVDFEKYLDTVQPILPVVQVVQEQFGRIPLAVATGGIPRICHGILDRIGIRGCFQTIVTADDVEHPKPHPAVYLEAARRLGVNPLKCLAYEDTDPGLEAARAAGMQVVDVRTFYLPKRITTVEV